MSHGLSVREREAKAILDAIVETAPESARKESSPAVVRANYADVVRNRDRAERQTFQQDAATPAQAAHNERARTIEMYANAHEERLRQEAEEKARAQRKRDEKQQRLDNIAKEQERVRLAHLRDDVRNREAREAAIAYRIQKDAKRQITELIRQYDVMDKLDELQAIVKREGFGMTSVPAWETACKLVAETNGVRRENGK
jgi:hypothetical protein